MDGRPPDVPGDGHPGSCCLLLNDKVFWTGESNRGAHLFFDWFGCPAFFLFVRTHGCHFASFLWLFSGRPIGWPLFATNGSKKRALLEDFLSDNNTARPKTRSGF